MPSIRGSGSPGLSTLVAVLLVGAVLACSRQTRSADVTATCNAMATFADGKQPTRISHVTTVGNDATGDGSAARPFRTIERAARNASPGTAIYIHAGIHAGGAFLTGLRGTVAAPIWITGVPGEARPVIEGGGDALHVVKPRYLVLQRLEIRDAAGNGINIDDGDAVADADAARYVLLQDLEIHDTGRRPGGVVDCLKLAGVRDFVVLRSTFARCGMTPGSGAVGVGGVGVHRGTLSFDRFVANGYGGAQFKGGSDDIEVVANYFEETGWRAVNLGGRTGEPFFRPPLSTAAPNYEAARIHVQSNVFVGSEAAAAFTGCVDCEFSHNTVVNPSKWVLRILQESVTTPQFVFLRSSKGRIADNVFAFRRAELNTGEDINVGRETDTRSFALDRNLWYAHDLPRQSAPRLGNFEGVQTGAFVGIDPEFVDTKHGDFRLTRRSVAVAAGDSAFTPRVDFAGRCYARPPTLGALQ